MYIQIVLIIKFNNIKLYNIRNTIITSNIFLITKLLVFFFAINIRELQKIIGRTITINCQ